MKRVVFFIAIVVGVLMASCSLDQEVQVTPSVGTSHLICSHADSLYTDTLTAKRNENGVYKIGAIHKGDTVRFMITIVASPNSLTGFSMAYDSTILSIGLDSIEKIQSVLLDTSDPQHGKLYFKPSCVGARFPAHYIPIKTGVADIKLTVESDSKYSPNSLSMIQPIE